MGVSGNAGRMDSRTFPPRAATERRCFVETMLTYTFLSEAEDLVGVEGPRGLDYVRSAWIGIRDHFTFAFLELRIVRVEFLVDCYKRGYLGFKLHHPRY